MRFSAIDKNIKRESPATSSSSTIVNKNIINHLNKLYILSFIINNKNGDKIGELKDVINSILY